MTELMQRIAAFFDILSTRNVLIEIGAVGMCLLAGWTGRRVDFDRRRWRKRRLEVDLGIGDERWGEAVHAVVVTAGAVSEEELRSHCAQRLAPFKVPKTITFAQRLPRTASGKLQRSRLPVDDGHATP